MKKQLSGLILLASSSLVSGCLSHVDDSSFDDQTDEDVAVAEQPLIAPNSCSTGTITYGQSNSTSVPAATYCFTQPVYNDTGAKYHYKIQFGPASGGNWVTSGQQLAAWTGGKFGIRIWLDGNVIVEKIKPAGTTTSPIETTFYGLSGKKYYIQTGIMYANGEFCGLCAVPWFMKTNMISLGAY